MAYYQVICRFFAWCDQNRTGSIADIEPLHIAAYIEALGQDLAKPTVKDHLAAIRMFFDWLVTGHVVAVNPVTSVRAPTHVVRRMFRSVFREEFRAFPTASLPSMPALPFGLANYP